MSLIQKPRKAPIQARSQHMVDTILEATAHILAEHGYAGTNTNRVAAHAGVSIGSVYQYFPNKDALIAALHEHHAAQISVIINRVLNAAAPRSLEEHITALVEALLAAHEHMPQLHKVLEKELPFFDPPKAGNPVDDTIFKRIRHLLDTYEHQINQTNLDLAAWVMLNMLESLIHAAVIDPPQHLSRNDIAVAITDAICGFLHYERTQHNVPSLSQHDSR